MKQNCVRQNTGSGIAGKWLLALAAVLLPAMTSAADGWSTVPRTTWKGKTEAEVPALKKKFAAAVALPAKSAAALAVAGPDQPPGLYEVRLLIRPSHTNDSISFFTKLSAINGAETVAAFPAHSFARRHEPETRTFQMVHTATGPLQFQLVAVSDADIAGKQRVKTKLKQGGPKLGGELGGDDDDDLDFVLDLVLSPDQAVYFLIDKVEFRQLSRSGHVTKLEINKIRYLPGETLKGSAEIADAGGKGGKGSLKLYLEHNVKDRSLVKTVPVTLQREPTTLSFDVPLPKEELGYALIAEYVSADGKDHAERAEYFNIARQFQRVAIFGGGLRTRDAILEEGPIRAELTKARKNYFNANEYFSWAADDMVEMSPEKDFWSSGQTNYRMHKQTIQRQIRLAHEQGLAAVTYGKNVMSGFKGWQTAYDYPNDHRGQYNYPVGMWNEINTIHFDRRRANDFVVYGRQPHIKGNRFELWWSSFLPISPDGTPQAVQIAAEEVIRSIDMFGWDMIRWDGHFRGGGHWVQCGRAGKYQAWAARKTQSLMRYFKSIVNARYPNFSHGYNYLLIQKNKTHDWAVEDFELDELCRGGGLLMNESIGNASAGWTFDQIVTNLQADGDVCRERGGFYLGISFGSRNPPRDEIIESALWAAAGCRPYNTAMTRNVRRYCTRYSQYTFDERMRRLTRPEEVLAPQSKTSLWWQPFVYETPLENSKRKLVVNLLNIPRKATRPPREGDIKPKYDMPPGTAPVAFKLTLPKGLKAAGAHLITPETLEVTELPLQDDRLKVPAVAVWRVLVVDLTVGKGAPSLASLYGPPKTFGVKRKNLKPEERKPDVVLDPEKELWEVNKQIGALAPEWEIKRAREQAALKAMSPKARAEALLAKRPKPEKLMKQWWKGGSLPHDLKLKDKKFNFGNLAPQRNGRFDIFYGRGAMDYRLRTAAAFGRLGRIHIHDAPMYGVLRHHPGLRLRHNVNWRRYPEFDALLFTSIPHCAIGAENSYALPHYVKAGGGVFFVGGEYAFGKGGYMYTVLERALLPLKCTGMTDTVYTRTPQVIEPGPEFAALKVKLDFSAKPSFWVRNQVVLNDGAKVLLKSGDIPVLVGRQLGKGRVACLLIDYRGRSDKNATAFFDWEDWPKLMAAALRWVAPMAAKATTAPAGNLKKILAQLKDAGTESALDDLDLEEDDLGMGLGDAGSTNAANTTELKKDALAKRLALINEALNIGGPEVAAALAAQLTKISNFPLYTRLKALPELQKHRPPNAAKLGATAVTARNSVVRGNGYLLLALAGSPKFMRHLTAPQSIPGESSFQRQERYRDLSLGLALYPKPDLVKLGKKRVAALNQEEKAAKAAFAARCGDDLDLLNTNAFLDAEETLRRAAWLAYLGRCEAEAYGTQFTKEWLMLGEYRDYCDRTVQNLYKEKKLKGAAAKAQADAWRNLSRRLAALQDLTRQDVVRLVTASPESTAEALATTRFAPETRACINLLGNMEPAATKTVLTKLKGADNPDVAGFAENRLQ